MKSKIIVVLFLTTISLLKAQEGANAYTSVNNEYKQNAGNKSFEVNFDPGKIFGSNPGDQFNLFDGGIKFRSFSSETSAFRIGFNISYLNYTDIIQQDPELKSKTSNLSIMVMPGFEKHFVGIARLSPYIGIQGLLGFTTTAYTMETSNTSKMKWVNDPNEAGYGSLDIGLGVFAGVDYYFVRKLYLGIEIGYGGQYFKFLKTKFTDDDNTASNYEDTNGYFIDISPSLATGNLRLGWTF